jgi:hypothetical protein
LCAGSLDVLLQDPVLTSLQNSSSSSSMRCWRQAVTAHWYLPPLCCRGRQALAALCAVRRILDRHCQGAGWCNSCSHGSSTCAALGLCGQCLQPAVAAAAIVVHGAPSVFAVRSYVLGLCCTWLLREWCIMRDGSGDWQDGSDLVHSAAPRL